MTPAGGPLVLARRAHEAQGACSRCATAARGSRPTTSPSRSSPRRSTSATAGCGTVGTGVGLALVGRLAARPGRPGRSPAPRRRAAHGIGVALPACRRLPWCFGVIPAAAASCGPLAVGARRGPGRGLRRVSSTRTSPGHYPLCPTKALMGLDCPFCGGLRAAHCARPRRRRRGARPQPLVVAARAPGRRCSGCLAAPRVDGGARRPRSAHPTAGGVRACSRGRALLWSIARPARRVHGRPQRRRRPRPGLAGVRRPSEPRAGRRRRSRDDADSLAA